MVAGVPQEERAQIAWDRFERLVDPDNKLTPGQCAARSA
jgi:hypothetical protein